MISSVEREMKKVSSNEGRKVLEKDRLFKLTFLKWWWVKNFKPGWSKASCSPSSAVRPTSLKKLPQHLPTSFSRGDHPFFFSNLNRNVCDTRSRTGIDTCKQSRWAALMGEDTRHWACLDEFNMSSKKERSAVNRGHFRTFEKLEKMYRNLF